jgi:hypothetical protein
LKTTLSLKAQKRNGRIRKTENLKNLVNVRLEIRSLNRKVKAKLADPLKEVRRAVTKGAQSDEDSSNKKAPPYRRGFVFETIPIKGLQD